MRIKRTTMKAKKIRKMFAVTLALICTLAGVNIASATDVTTQSELQDILNSGGTATVTKDITLSSNLQTVRKQGESATYNLTLIGDTAGRYISGNSQWSGIHYEGKGNNLSNTITISNIEFNNTKSSVGTLCIVSNTHTSFSSSPAKITTTLTNNTFRNNNATLGGAILQMANVMPNSPYDSISEMTITAGDFINNTATNGGAIYNEAYLFASSSGYGTAEIKGISGSFIGNTATQNGGAIYNIVTKEDGANGTGTAKITLNDVVFKNNYSNWDGETGTLNDIYNTGTVNVAGNVSMTGGITGTGTTNITNTGTLKLVNGATLQQGTVTLDGTLDLANGEIDTITTNGEISGNGGLRLDLINDNIDNITVTGGDASGIKISALNLHNIPNGFNYQYLKNADTYPGWNQNYYVATAETSDVYMGSNVFDFATNAVGGIYLSETSGPKTLHDIVIANTDAPSKVISWSITNPSTPYEVGADGLGELNWTNRDTFTIFGNGGTINGNNYEGITIGNTANKTFNIEDVTMTGFNKTSSVDNVYGGAIDNSGTITTVSGKYTTNHITSAYFDACGGAISNSGTITNLNADFDSNTATSVCSALGGAISNSGTITNLSGNYTNNNVTSPANFAIGGAIYNNATITNINSDFTGNYTLGTLASQGGAIYNESGATITNLNSDFTGNYTSGSNASQGGAIYNKGTIGDITNLTKAAIGTSDNNALFKYNGIEFENNDQLLKTKEGGAIYNTGTITNIYADFDHNAVTDNGGAIYNVASKTINFLTGTFDGNIADGLGGAIYNAGTIGYNTTEGGIGTSDKHATFTGNGVAENGVRTQQGGAIYNAGTITSIYADFDGNKATSSGGAIYNKDTISTLTADFIGNYTDNQSSTGGAIYNKGTISIQNSYFEGNGYKDYGLASQEAKTLSGGAILQDNGAGTLNISDTTFKNNVATQYGGAIANAATINLSGKNEFTGNKANGTPNDICNMGILNINSGTTTMDGGIDDMFDLFQEHAGTINIKNGATLALKHAFDADGNDLGLATLTQGEINVENGGIIDLQNGKIDTLDLANLGDESYVTFNLDFDGSKSAGSNIDKINISLKNNTGSATAKVNAIKITGDAKASGTTTATWLVADFNKITDATATDPIKSATENYLYKFQKNGDGVFDVTMTKIADLTLPEVVHNSDYTDITSYSLINDCNLTSDEYLGTLAEPTSGHRNFTIFGNGHIIDASNSTVDANGITIQTGQTFEIAEATMKGFKNSSTTADVYGGAINNSGTITSIDADFTNNSVTTTANEYEIASNGGAIAVVSGRIDTITGNFTQNSATASGGTQYSNTCGGAIFVDEESSIGNINADFSKNSVTTSGSAKYNDASGGAIYNDGEIDSISGKFSYNSAVASDATMTSSSTGGAIINNEYIGTISGDFEYNFTQASASTSDAAMAVGSAIANNNAEIETIQANFVGNYAKDTAISLGGAIFSMVTSSNGIGNIINSTFKENYVIGTGNIGFYEITDISAGGGAILNIGSTTIKDTSFTNNSATSKGTKDAVGGAIAQAMGTLTLAKDTGTGVTFSGNSVSAEGAGNALGGAIYNKNMGTASTVTASNAEFIGNYAKATTGNARGGAIYNESVLSIQNSYFEGNGYSDYDATTHKGTTVTTNEGGAIYNAPNSTLNLSGTTFLNNTASLLGGAIFNEDGGATQALLNITGTNIFEGNSVVSDSNIVGGGAIYNGSTQDNIINATFNNNFVKTTADTKIAQGGAIYNAALAEIETLNCSFTGNYAESASANAYGGAIYNEGTITNLVADFTGNYAKATAFLSASYGGAVYNKYGATIANIGASDKPVIFSNNGTDANGNVTISYGGAIYNLGDITNIYGDFTGNKASTSGGAILNSGEQSGGTITLIDGNFTNNSARRGGAICNMSSATIDTITGNFTGNTATSDGGAIYNSGSLLLKGTNTFENNYSNWNDTTGTLNDIHNTNQLTIWGTSTTATDIVSMTGGITGTGSTVLGDGTNKVTLKLGKDATLLQDTLTVKNATLDFINNSVGASDQYKVDYFKTVNESGEKATFKVDVANVNGTPTMDKLVFTAVSSGYNPIVQLDEINVVNDIDPTVYPVMTFLDSTKTGTERDAELAKITDNTSTIKTATEGIVYTFSGHNADPTTIEKGQVKIGVTEGNITLPKIIQNTTGIAECDNIPTFSLTKDSILISALGELNYAGTGDRTLAIFGNGHTIDGGGNEGVSVSSGQTLNINDATMQNFKADPNGGVIHNSGTIGKITANFIDNCADAEGGAIYNNGTITTITSSTFEGNGYDGTTPTTISGGAIYNDDLATINEISGTTFTNNVATTSGGAIFNAGTMTVANSTFSGNTVNDTPNDIYNEGGLTFVGTNSLEGGITDATDTQTGTTNIGDGSTLTTVTLGNNATLQQNQVNLNHNATLALGEYSANNFDVNTFTVNGCTLSIQNGSVDAFAFNKLVLNDSLDMRVDADLAAGVMDTIDATDTVTANGHTINVANINLLSDATEAATTITFTTDSDLMGIVNYTGDQDIAYSSIYKYGVGYNNSDGKFTFTRTGGSNGYNPAVLAASVAQQGAFLTQINTYDQAFTGMDMLMNLSQEERTAYKYANRYASSGVNEGPVTFSPNQVPEESAGLWFRPFASFEKVNLAHGPETENNTYGMMFGGDSGIIELSHGWDMTWGAYAGYTGSHQNYDGVSIYQNGGTLGLNAAWYKGNFFTGLTANVGASVAEADTMYGNENFTMLMTGIASKTGYNWEVFNSKLIIQPSLLLSYSFINTFDYTNAAGVDIGSSPLNAIQIVPGIKFIGNLPHGWQPYLNVQMVWNIMDETKFYANDVHLPQMSVEPYIQYGVGLQKRWGDRFTGFGQVMFRNGGRTGVALNAGFRWAIGKEYSKASKAHSDIPTRETKINLTAKK